MKQKFILLLTIIVTGIFFIILSGILSSCTSLLYKNAKTGNVVNLRNFFVKYPTVDVDRPDFKKDTALLIATQQEKIDVIKELLSRNASPSYTRPDSYTPLRAAIDKQNQEIVALFIQADADVNITNKNGWTPLMSAAKAGNLDIVKMLIDAGANVHATTKIGYTASATALSSENFHIKDYIDGIVKSKPQKKKNPKQ